LATTITAGIEAGAVEPAFGAGAQIMGTPSSAHHGNAELGAGDHLGGAVLVDHQGRRGHRVDAEALRLAGQRAHLLHDRHDVAVPRRHEERLARAAQHGVDLGHVVDGLRHVLRQAHRHHEVDVGEPFAEGGLPLDVVLAHAASFVCVGVGDVEHVRPRPEVAVGRVERERRGLAATRLEQPAPRG
jgi:hypothetical protein